MSERRITLPPPPYSILHRYKDDAWIVYRSSFGDGPNVQIDLYETHAEALQERDRLNAAYMQGWRDRDEADDE
jgi:hypothetical protein